MSIDQEEKWNMPPYDYGDSREDRRLGSGSGKRIEAVALCRALELHIMVNRPLGWHTNRVEPLTPAYCKGLIASMCLLTGWCIL